MAVRGKDFAIASNRLNQEMLHFKIYGMITRMRSCLVNEVKEKGIFSSQHRKKELQKEIMAKVEAVNRSPSSVFFGYPTSNGIICINKSGKLPLYQFEISLQIIYRCLKTGG